MTLAPTVKELAKMIDHSLLHPTMTDSDMTQELKVAMEYDVASVCIKPYAVPLAVEILKGSEVLVGTVVGFPHGNSIQTWQCITNIRVVFTTPRKSYCVLHRGNSTVHTFYPIGFKNTLSFNNK